MDFNLGIYLIAGVIGGMIAGSIAGSRGLSFGSYFVIGFLLPIIGIIVAAVASPPGPLSQLTPAESQGWWPDPMGRFDHRYYDGRAWTRFVGRAGEQFEDPV